MQLTYNWVKIGENLVRYGMNEELFVDFVDVDSHDKANTLTISYIMPSAFHEMEENGLLSQQQVQHQLAIIQNVPRANAGFFQNIMILPLKNMYLTKNYT